MKADTVLGFDLEWNGKNGTITLRPRWWTPLAFAWFASGEYAPWYWRPAVFLYAAAYFTWTWARR